MNQRVPQPAAMRPVKGVLAACGTLTLTQTI